MGREFLDFLDSFFLVSGYAFLKTMGLIARLSVIRFIRYIATFLFVRTKLHSFMYFVLLATIVRRVFQNLWGFNSKIIC
jgi:hypothetical protein